MDTKIKKNRISKIAIIAIVCALPLLSFIIGYWQKSTRANVPLATDNAYLALPVFHVADLASYNGMDPALPIYIGLNGLVYDVSAGRKFYESGASYQYLAGKDSSKDLNMIGGDIIARKYPVIARLAP